MEHRLVAQFAQNGQDEISWLKLSGLVQANNDFGKSPATEDPTSFAS